MAKFASSKSQATAVIKKLQGKHLRSVGTVRNYEQALNRVAEYCKQNQVKGGLIGLSADQAITYLEYRGQLIGQKALDMERQAIQAMMTHVTSKLQNKQKLTVIRSEKSQSLNSRAYTYKQSQLISEAQTAKHSLATEIALHAGLRAHELLTLAKVEERPASKRPSSSSKWKGREGVIYTVHGKGGLIREVLLSKLYPNSLKSID
ncbi:hypothetical protein [Parashewanella hymeniacidonis]|uniref:hypothetical protein n=1 Tax=Parashewanella hymeniacidonis TaxID=2807618 RepID=UPI0030841150